jgi:hypothetical protein
MALKIKESAIQKAVMDYLQLDGWRCFHFEYGFDERSKKTHGEPGMPDLLCIRYFNANKLAVGGAAVLWIELKSSEGCMTSEQRIWRQAETDRGGLVWAAGLDFLSTIDGWLEHYRKSGLNRRPI